jgi:hypothetical protein
VRLFAVEAALQGVHSAASFGLLLRAFLQLTCKHEENNKREKQCMVVL